MSLAETIASFGGSAVIEQVAKKFGLPESLTSQAVGMLLPALSAGVSRNISKEGGLGSLLGALTDGSHTNYLSTPESISSPEATQDGNAILGHLLGGKDASRSVAATVAGALGIENDTVKKMLPMVASMAMGALSKQSSDANLTKESGGSSDILGQLTSMLGSEGAGDILGKLFS